MKKKLIIGITGATGAIYGIRLLQLLQSFEDIETHLIVSQAGLLTVQTETAYSKKQLQELADETHPIQDIGASIASGSSQTMGMIIAPCSMNTLGCIANGISQNLITRAADVILKERRPLILQTRETPLNLAHINNMQTVTQMGGIIAPPNPSFYTQPNSIDELVTQTSARLLDLLNIPNNDAVKRWQGIGQTL